MLKKHTFTLITMLLFGQAFAQQKTKIIVKDEWTGAGVEDVQVLILQNNSLKFLSFTDEQGELETSLVAGNAYEVKLSRLGYEDKSFELNYSGKKQLSYSLEPTTETKEEVIVSAIRSQKKRPATAQTLTKKEIVKVNAGKDMPYVLEGTPSVVTYSDAGAGIGYTGMRIRGVDATRINVTINGMPYNDAESHGVFWVDMPDLASSVSSVQIQRGVGTSTNGAAAFGASVNVKTDHINQKRFGAVEVGGGSFGTRRANIQMGTGVTKSGWGAQARASLIQSEGFVDRASADLYSAFITAAHYGKKSLFKFNAILGKEITYQSWYGTPQPKFNGDTMELNRYIDQLWIEGDELENLQSSDAETYNYYTYQDQVDNYTQNHYQAFYSHQFLPIFRVQGGLNYTRGLGYYEEFKADDDYAFYGLSDVVIGNDTFSSGNIIRRRWLDNHFYGGVVTAFYTTPKLEMTLGISQHFYKGGHYGRVISKEHSIGVFKETEYYNNNADKSLNNGFIKLSYRASKKLSVYADLQARTISYKSEGLDNGGGDTKLDLNYSFFNPKAGVNFALSRNANIYATYGRAGREPVRSDLINSSNNSRPIAEQLDDLELGYSLEKKKLKLDLNAYLMIYQNQLVLTGRINDVGASTRENVDNSYRTGIEGSLKYQVNDKMDVYTVFTLSENKIAEYKEYIYSWDTSENKVITHENTDIALSPAVLGNVGMSYKVHKKVILSLSNRYVGSQYLDNTSNSNRSLDPYNLVDASVRVSHKLKGEMPFFFDVFLYNLLNQSYAANGYTFNAVIAGRVESFNYVYPQAGFHFMIKTGFRF